MWPACSRIRPSGPAAIRLRWSSPGRVEAGRQNRAGAYADGARQGAPAAVQAADRWHLLENCSRALLEAVRRRRAEVEAAARPVVAGPAAPAGKPPPMTSAERRQWEQWWRGQQSYEQVVRFYREGMPIRAIGRRLRIGRNTVRRG